jgi:GT2 family glycosyltransferase
MRFSHIVATKGRPDLLRDVLESSLATLPQGSEAIVVDGDPQRSGEAVVRELDPNSARIRYVSSEPGLTRQRNQGIRAAKGDVVVFTDDDCTLQPGVFEALAAAYADPALVGATGRVRRPQNERIGSDPNSRLRRLVLGGGRQGTMTSFGFRRPVVDLDSEHEMQYMPGAFMSARREAAAKVGFDERLSGYALGEDDDFSLRLSREGRVRYLPDAVVYHHALGQRTDEQRDFNRSLVANRAYLLEKNFGRGVRTKLGFAALLAIYAAHRILNREWDALRGLVEGVLELRRSKRGTASRLDAG